MSRLLVHTHNAKHHFDSLKQSLYQLIFYIHDWGYHSEYVIGMKFADCTGQNQERGFYCSM